MKENNFIYTVDNVLDQTKCDLIINYFKNKTEKIISNGINYAHFQQQDYLKFDFLKDVVTYLFKNYCDKFPEVNHTGKWIFSEFRFKHFKPGNYFKIWHSEHSIKEKNRLLCLQIYLSTHNCGTEFYNGETILSKAGRAIIFPAYFTHTHRGQVCPDLKDRFILGGYANFIQ